MPNEKKKKEEIEKPEGLENAKDEYIESLIYHAMWNSLLRIKKQIEDIFQTLLRIEKQKRVSRISTEADRNHPNILQLRYY